MKQKSAFTLIEALLSVVIISIGTIFILQAFSREITVLGLGRDNIRAALLLKEKMAEIEEEVRQEGSLSKIPFSGRFSGSKEKDFGWSLDLFPCTLGEGLTKVHLSCFWSRRGKARSVSLETFVREEDR